MLVHMDPNILFESEFLALTLVNRILQVLSRQGGHIVHGTSAKVVLVEGKISLPTIFCTLPGAHYRPCRMRLKRDRDQVLDGRIVYRKFFRVRES